MAGGQTYSCYLSSKLLHKPSCVPPYTGCAVSICLQPYFPCPAPANRSPLYKCQRRCTQQICALDAGTAPACQQSQQRKGVTTPKADYSASAVCSTHLLPTATLRSYSRSRHAGRARGSSRHAPCHALTGPVTMESGPDACSPREVQAPRSYHDDRNSSSVPPPVCPPPRRT